MASMRLSLDQGRCILCGRCIRERPDVFAWSPGAAAATLTRTGLVVPELDETDQGLAAVRSALAARTAGLRRSVHLRHVDAGSDGAEEQEIAALLNPVYDIHRLGIFFTASPRHADVLLVTGAGAHGMAEPLRRTYTGMPDPKIVIAVGTDAVSGGLLGEIGRRASGLVCDFGWRWRGGPGGRVGAGLAAAAVRHLACLARWPRPAAGQAGTEGARR